MPSSSLFAGVVTHARSRFNVDGAAGAMLDGLASALGSHGIATEVLVSDRDDYRPEDVPITTSLLAKSARHQARLEHQWRRYLVSGGGDGRGHVSDLVMREAMSAKRLVTGFGGSAVASAAERPGAAAMIRLLNIDMSHLRVLDSAAAAGSDWVLVIEDDAGVVDPDRTAAALASLISALGPTDVAFANLSESISLVELGVSGILAPADDLALPEDLGLTVLRASQPVTNTVCATLYRAPYARRLAQEIRSRGLTPVAPIDWRVNEVIMDLVERGELGAQSCVWVSPGLFVQRSMHG